MEKKINVLKFVKRLSRNIQVKPTQVMSDPKENKKKIIQKEIEKWQEEKE